MTDTWVLGLSPAYCGTVRRATAKFYDLQGCIFKILICQPKQCVFTPSKEKWYLYKQLESREALWILREQKDSSISLHYKIETWGTLCSSFDFSGGCRILADSRIPFIQCFKGRTVSRCLSWTSALPSHLGNWRALPLGRGEVGSLSKQALLEENGYASVFSRYHSVVCHFKHMLESNKLVCFSFDSV